MSENFANNFSTVLTGPLTATATTLAVASSTGAPPPNFRIAIDQEILLVTAVSGTSWTVARGQENTTAAAHLQGALVQAELTAGGLANLPYVAAPTAAAVAGQVLTAVGSPPVPTWAASSGTIAAATRAALSATADASLPDGQPAFNEEALYRANWQLSKTSTLTADGVTVLATNSGTGRWILKSRLAGTVPVTEVGADPTGSVDSSSAFSAAVSALTGTGIALLVPGGNFQVQTAPTYTAAVRLVYGEGASFSGAGAAAMYDWARTPTVFHIVGDSNTAGLDGVGGYRAALYEYLRQRRSDFDFVGSLCDNRVTTTQQLTFHDGHSGYTIAQITSGYATWAASPGVGTPHVVVDMIGTNDIATARTLAQMQADRAAMDAAIDAVFPNAVRFVLGVLPLVPGSTTGANQAAWDAQRVSYNAWLRDTYIPSKGSRYQFHDIGGALGQGNYFTDGVHLLSQGDAAFGELLAARIDAWMGPQLNGQPYPRTFKQQAGAYGLQFPTVNAAASLASGAAAAGFNPGTGSLIFALDFCPAFLDTTHLRAIAVYGSYGATPFYGLYAEGRNLSLYWVLDSGAFFAGYVAQQSLTVNQWHRIVIIADASTSTVGLYVNGECVGVKQGVTAWSFSQLAFHLGNDGTFASCPGFYANVESYVGQAVPRPGSMAAQLAVENDYYERQRMTAAGPSIAYDLNNSYSTGYYNNTALTPANSPVFANCFPNGMPLRPWDVNQRLASSAITQTRGLYALSTTGGTTTLDISDMMQADVVEVSGTLTSNATIVLPSVPGLRLSFANLTSGAFTVTVQAASGSTLTQGKRCSGYVDTAYAWQWDGSER